MRFPTSMLGDATKFRAIGDRGLRHTGLFLLGFMISIGGGVIVNPAQGQVSTTITNTATGSFRQTPNDPLVPTTSNSTQVPAQLLILPRPALEIIKSGDRSAAEPGDTVIYRLLIRNTGNAPASNITVTDTLPIGLKFLPNTVRAGIQRNGVLSPLTIAAPTVNGQVITFNYPGPLVPQGETLTLVYGALLLPDAVRGNGRNLAVAEGIDASGRFVSNTASHKLQIRPGLLSDCGTIIGRVFVDKNFDGEQQPGEPGVPNAVIFMDDGNRITTDENGLYSVSAVIAGSRTGVLDLSSLPGYTLAPNLYRIEANSASRMVNLSPGGMARMNFAVTPTFGEGKK
jgi:uncharacterized repeat protein (TIGR01451 family)